MKIERRFVRGRRGGGGGVEGAGGAGRVRVAGVCRLRGVGGETETPLRLGKARAHGRTSVSRSVKILG